MSSWRAALLVLLASMPLRADPVDPIARASVVTSIRPLALIVRALAGDLLDVQTLPGVDAAPHDFVLRPSGLQAMRSASLFVWMGPTLEQPLARVLERNAPVRALAVLPALGEGGAADPHIWLDPRRATEIARVLAGALREHGLVDAAAVEAGLARFARTMAEREVAMAHEFTGIEAVPFMAMHDGLRVIVARFGLRQVGALPASHDAQPGARSIMALRRTARETRAACLFRESSDSIELAATIAEDTPMQLVLLDTLAREAPDSAQGFDRFLQSIARHMARCLRVAVALPVESTR